MAMKDYYATLMVHPQAEQFLIEAAYKRLAREYHPDRKQSNDNHEKMIAINEAFAVLSDPNRRKSYDREYTQQSLSNQLFATTAETATKQRDQQRASSSPSKKAADPLRGNVSPVPPDPAAFGIDANYLARAREGAQAWQRREHRIPHRVKWVARAVAAVVGIVVSLMFFRSGVTLAAFAWLILPLLAELTMRIIERIRDAHLLRYKYNPLYNPNPAGYRAFAEASATYEAETMIVYVTRDAKFHAQKTCQAMTSYDPMPKWFALLRNAKACSVCKGFGEKRIKNLPHPFSQESLLNSILRR